MKVKQPEQYKGFRLLCRAMGLATFPGCVFCLIFAISSSSIGFIIALALQLAVCIAFLVLSFWQMPIRKLLITFTILLLLLVCLGITNTILFLQLPRP